MNALASLLGRRRSWLIASSVVGLILAALWSYGRADHYESHVELSLLDAQAVDDGQRRLLESIRSSTTLTRASAHVSRGTKGATVDELRQSVVAAPAEAPGAIGLRVSGPSRDDARDRARSIVIALRETPDAVRVDTKLLAMRYHDSLTNAIAASARRLEDLWRERLRQYDSDDDVAALRDDLHAVTNRLQDLRASGNYTEEFPAIQQLARRRQEIEATLQDRHRADEQEAMAAAAATVGDPLAAKMEKIFAEHLDAVETEPATSPLAFKITRSISAGTPVRAGNPLSLPLGAAIGFGVGLLLAAARDRLPGDATGSGVQQRIPTVVVEPHQPEPHQPEPHQPEPAKDAALEPIPYFGGEGQARGGSPSAVSRASLIFPQCGDDAVFAALKPLRDRLSAPADDGAPSCLLFTGAVPGAGKTSVAGALAIAWAEAGERVLLIDAETNSPYGYSIFGLPRPDGLSEILAAERPWREMLKDYYDVAIGERAAEDPATTPGMERLLFLTAGEAPVVATEVLAAPEFNRMLEECKTTFDRVLIDGPTIRAGREPVAAPPAVDRIVLVQGAEQTVTTTFQHTVAHWRSAAPNRFFGVLVNGERPTGHEVQLT